MSQSKKYGTFAAVFTPSVLTILGAIMYLRLGWVVGQAGLYKTLIIICLAHIISFTTGLSISSIATDKKIQKGGIYYVLSRSLGLPMGGAIGIGITLAMILNLALHVIGFSESFLAIDSISNFFGLAPSIASYRIIGSVVLAAIVILALVSTSSAVKSQYFVMGAIVLSFISIILGFILKVEPAPATPNLNSIPDMLPFMYIFGIFFPATTGFTTGVAMSGDLKDPKRSIPRGVMGAIITGFVIYIALTFCFAFCVDRNLLLKDNNFLTKVAWNSPLVIMGIWGATLSTALGSILGAPRILQAIALDKIAPKIFAKGYGKNNEPRNAIICVAILAEVAVLIGDLNKIAPIAAMFFMVSYACINLAFFLEKWASTDFRPAFKVSKYIGLLGVITCVYMMSELNVGAMFAAVAMVAVLYFIIRKRNVKLEYGDVWQSVLLSITRSTLKKITKRKLENRNWQPNVLAFTGNKEKRPYLIDFGKWLVGQHGFISTFELNETTEDRLFTAHKTTSVNGLMDNLWLEPVSFACTDVYEGMETLAVSYGFSGLEPNSIVMGFSANAENPERFSKMMANLSKINKNILMMHYSKDTGFGNKKNIDIWISSGEVDSLFALNIVKLLWINDVWAQSALRINIISNNNNAYSFIYNKLDSILDQMRIEAEIRIINNEIDNKPVKTLIESHSVDSDIIFIGMPDFVKNPEMSYNEAVELSKIDKTIIFVKASNDFKVIGNLDIVTKQLILDKPAETNAPEKLSELVYPLRPEAASFVSELQERFTNCVNQSIVIKLNVLSSYFLDTFDTFSKSVDKSYKNINSVSDARRHALTAANMIKLNLNDLITKKVPDLTPLLSSICNDLFNDFSNMAANIPDIFVVFYDEELAFVSPEDSKKLMLLKARINSFYKKHKNEGKLYAYQGKIKNFVSFELKVLFNEILINVDKAVKQYLLSNYYEVNKIIYSINDVNIRISNNVNSPDFVLGDVLSDLRNQIKEASDNSNTYFDKLIEQFDEQKVVLVKNLKDYFDHLNFNDIHVDTKRLKVSNKDCAYAVNEDFGSLVALLPFIFNRTIINIDISHFKVRLMSNTDEIISHAKNYINNVIVQRHKDFKTAIINNRSTDGYDVDWSQHYDTAVDIFSLLTEVYDKIMKNIQRFATVIPIIDNAGLTQFEAVDNEDPNKFDFAASRVLDYLVQNFYYKQVRTAISDLNNEAQLSLSKQKNIVTQLALVNDDMLINKVETIIDNEVALLEEELNKCEKEILSSFELTYEKLQLESFIATASSVRNISVIVDDIANERGKFFALYGKIVAFAKNQFTQFWYKKSEGVIMTSQLEARDSEQEKLRKFMRDVANVSLSPEIEQSLPYSYKQMFVNTQHYNKELWVGKTKEINDFNVLLNQYRHLGSGAIMILGRIGSGKSFFSYHVAKTFLPNAVIISIKSLTGGSTSTNKFENLLLRTLEMPNVPLSKAMEEIPHGSVFIFENIEQWWHRNEGGNKVINKIISFIETYSKDYLFILNSNIIGYEAMSMTTDIKQVIIGSVSISPFNAEELEKIIMRRNSVGNMKLVINGHPEASLRAWNYAKLFSTYFKLSEGNIKSALNLWIACIDKVSSDTLYMHVPVFPDAIPFKVLSKQQIIFLAQFVIHNNMSYERIFAISKRSMNEITKDLNVLIRLGVIERKTENIFGLNTVLYPFIVNELKRIEII